MANAVPLSKFRAASWKIFRPITHCNYQQIHTAIACNKKYNMCKALLDDSKSVKEITDKRTASTKHAPFVNGPKNGNDLTGKGKNPNTRCHHERIFESLLEVKITPQILKSLKAEYSTAAPTGAAALTAYMALQELINSYQTRGYTQAKVDPLQLPATKVVTASPPDPINDFERFSEKDLNLGFELPPETYIGGSEKTLPLREIIKRLKETYCGTIGVEYSHIKNKEQAEWMKKRVETPGAYNFTKEERIMCLHRMLTAGAFEAFCARKWTSEKRFGLEGCDALIPLIEFIIDRSAELGVETFVIGMPHRGRLNLFTSICRMPLNSVFVQFHGIQPEEKGCGDVKYHLGACVQVANKRSKKNVKVIVVANPSHLEVIAGVVLGRTRSEQFFTGDEKKSKVMAVLFHGDAAFCGQGIVYETIQMSSLKNYCTGGCIHIVVNNQIGYTAEPRQSRSSLFCTDIGKIIDAPVLHVNAEDPDKTIPVAFIASEFRQKFGKDVMIDLVGYRRHGHNEADEPMFTNPTMYTLIRSMTPAWQSYGDRLVKDGTVTDNDVKKFIKDFDDNCQKELDLSLKAKSVKFSDWLDSPWKGWFKGKDLLKFSPTGVKEDILKQIGQKFSEPPPQFKIHKGVEKILKERQELVSKRLADWSLSEAFAFGSLLKEGIHVRLSGLDVERGTFSQRHHVIHHQSEPNKTYVPLSNLWPDQAAYVVCNSSLSQYAVMCYEAGYSMTSPKSLAVWESPYGDFFDTGQPALDLFINSGESKWIRQSGVVLLLPHGMEGHGPDHSSARVERILQLSSDDSEEVPEMTNTFAEKQLLDANWIVVNCSNPANYFHVLRRQIAMPFRKPLVVFTPKSYLRRPEMQSSFDNFTEKSGFRRVIPDPGPASKTPGNVKRLIFCAGTVYYEFKKERAKKGLDDKVALTRIEQLFPIPYDLILKECEKYAKAELYWGQEEHKNAGSWSFMRPRFKTLLKGKRKLIYCGRPASSPAATGSRYIHKKEHEALLKDAFKNV